MTFWQFLDAQAFEQQRQIELLWCMRECLSVYTAKHTEFVPDGMKWVDFLEVPRRADF
jgi:hypothetical protein